MKMDLALNRFVQKSMTTKAEPRRRESLRRRFRIPQQTARPGAGLTIEGVDARHMLRVLRLKTGDRVMLFDGDGFDYPAIITQTAADRVAVEIEARHRSACESPARIVIAQALLKGPRLDGIVRRLTELGVSRWIPFTCVRSIPQPDPKRVQARQARWRKIVQESMKQCGRSRTMKIDEPVAFADLLLLGKRYDHRILFYEDESTPLEAAVPPAGGENLKVLAVSGPEGGFTSREVEQARSAGFQPAGLGPRILRADTACMTAAVLMQHFFGDLGRKIA